MMLVIEVTVLKLMDNMMDERLVKMQVIVMLNMVRAVVLVPVWPTCVMV